MATRATAHPLDISVLHFRTSYKYNLEKLDLRNRSEEVSGGLNGREYCGRKMVGLPGFEPGTSCTPSKRASQAAPQPETSSV